ncbi:putative ATPase [Lipingzhangella halophila]|uniref:Putative ATPase n=1 Tax=Lipingzhangella halophila TaxID=1783352 RepID=A0A7W7W4A9_9ACTN|nr:AAA family ATPase [Lipingzhangella halophila]MBB4933403.1 putative ATPase [Lipingzhangella halophila]
MLIQRLHVSDDRLGGDAPDPQEWPYTIPAIGQLLHEGLEFTQPVTFLVGENGSGKSTLIEAVAEAYGINARGGRGSQTRKTPVQERSPLGQHLELDLTAQGAKYAANRKLKKRSYFLRAETAFDFINYVSSFEYILPGYWQEDLRVRSHGEGYLTVLRTILSEPGLYLMDEPEAALSFMSCLQLVGLLHEAGEGGAQIICATHSPILAATPEADIIEFTDTGAHHTTWDKLELVDHWRRYLAKPEKYLRHLVDE